MKIYIYTLLYSIKKVILSTLIKLIILKYIKLKFKKFDLLQSEFY